MKSYGKLTKQIVNILALFFIAVSVGCSAIKTEDVAETEEIILESVNAERTTDIETAEKAGSDIEVPEEETIDKPERVIALSKSNAELWLLAGGTLIATSDDALKLDGISEDTVGLGDMDHVSLEAIAALEPDLLILFSTEPSQKALGEAAEDIGITVYYTNIDNFTDYETVMTELTEYTGRTDLYESKVADVSEKIDEILNGVPSGEGEKTYLFLHVSATKSKVEKNDYFACEIFNRLGLINIAADDSAFDELSLEQIVTSDPDYIFVVTRGDEKKALDSFDELFTGRPAWEELSAVKNGRYYLLSKDLFGLKPNDRWAESYREAYTLLYGE